MSWAVHVNLLFSTLDCLFVIQQWMSSYRNIQHWNGNGSELPLLKVQTIVFFFKYIFLILPFFPVFFPVKVPFLETSPPHASELWYGSPSPSQFSSEMAELVGAVTKITSGFLEINSISIDNWGFKFFYKWTTTLLVFCSVLVTAK